MAEPDPAATALVGALLDALRRRRRATLVILVTPLGCAALISAALNLGHEEFAIPLGVLGGFVALVAVVAAIDAGLAVNRAIAALAAHPPAPGPAAPPGDG